MGIVDCHCDVISRAWREGESIYSNRGQFDVCRARQAGVVLQFMALFTEEGGNSALRAVLNQLDGFYRELAQHHQYMYAVAAYRDFTQNRNNGRLGCLVHLEGGEALGRDAGLLRIFYRLGVRSIGLTWNHRNLLADGVLEETSNGGLSTLGREVVKLAQELGMIVDLAHISSRGFYEVLDMAVDPVMVTHANARSLCDHHRNLTDEQLISLADNGGVVGCTLVPDFVHPEQPSFEKFIDHIVYICDLVGVEHVAIGSDFDGVANPVLQDVSEYQRLEPALRERGFTPGEIEKILQENCLSLLRKILK